VILNLIWIIPLMWFGSLKVSKESSTRNFHTSRKLSTGNNPLDTYLRLILQTFFFLSACMRYGWSHLARPQRSNERVEQFTKELIMLLVMDISESRTYRISGPIESLKATGVEFINGRRWDLIEWCSLCRRSGNGVGPVDHEWYKLLQN